MKLKKILLFGLASSLVGCESVDITGQIGYKVGDAKAVVGFKSRKPEKPVALPLPKPDNKTITPFDA